MNNFCFVQYNSIISAKKYINYSIKVQKYAVSAEDIGEFWLSKIIFLLAIA
jgi:hypothetical protein